MSPSAFVILLKKVVLLIFGPQLNYVICPVSEDEEGTKKKTLILSVSLLVVSILMQSS